MLLLMQKKQKYYISLGLIDWLKFLQDASVYVFKI